MGGLVADLLRKMPVAVMSGAGFPQFKTQFFSGLPGNTDFGRLYIFPTNAAECFVFDHHKGWQPIYDLAFSDAERTRILAAIKGALKDVGLEATPQPVWGERVEDRGAQITFSGLGQQAPLEEKEAWDPTGVKRKSFHEALAKRLPDFSEAVGGSTSVDITRKGITKANDLHSDDRARCNRGLDPVGIVAGVRADQFQPGKAVADAGEDKSGAVAILHAGRVDDDLHRQAFAVDQRMDLAALQALACVIAHLVVLRPPFSADLTVWLSRMAAVGLASRPSRSRSAM
jgi:hypothetical protein